MKNDTYCYKKDSWAGLSVPKSIAVESKYKLSAEILSGDENIKKIRI